MQISIIVPVYNTEKYLRECLDSLAAQTFTDIEVLLIDDGSTDRSGAICDEYAAKDPRFRVLHKENAGPAAARNAGLDLARGEYLMFCDSDDLYRPECCERMLALIREHDCDAVMCGNDFILESGECEGRTRDEEYYDPGLERLVGHENDEGMLSLNVLLWNKIFRRSKIVENGIRFPDGHEHDDDAFCYQYALCSDCYYCTAERLYRYRLRPGSIMDAYCRNRPKNREDLLVVLEYVLEFACRHGVEWRHRRFLLRLAALCYSRMSEFFDAGELAVIRDRIMSRFCCLFNGECYLGMYGSEMRASIHPVGPGDIMRFLQFMFKCAVTFGRNGKQMKRRANLKFYRERAWRYVGQLLRWDNK